MTGATLRDLLDALLPPHLLRDLTRSCGFERRARRRDATTFLRTLILASSSPSGGRQADLMRHYLDAGGSPVVRSSFYGWFDASLERVLSGLSDHAMAHVARLPVDLPGPLSLANDWRIVDSTTVLLPDCLRRDYPGAGAYAAVKVHKVLSVGRGTISSYHFAPARQHDSPHLVLDESWRGAGLLAYLAYASIDRLAAAHRLGILLVLRLKDRWRPIIDRVARADLRRGFVPGRDLLPFLDDVHLSLRNPIDLDVTVGGEVRLRLVGVAAPRAGHRFYLTNLPRRIGPHQVADLYRVRWEIETSNKVDKSGHRLHHIDARRPSAVRSLLHASLLASTLVGLLVHTHNRSTRSATGPRTRPPLHHGLVARMMSQCSSRLGAALRLGGTAAHREWDDLAALLTHASHDPNWRSKPSILDQWRGWRATSPTTPRLSSRASRP